MNFLQPLSLKTKYFPTGKAVGYTLISASSESILNATFMKKKNEVKVNNFRRKLNELFLYIGCSNCECDEGGALSSCQVPQCKPNHDLLIEETSCDVRGLKCCRMTCDGPGTMCLPDNAPNADLGQKSCKEGYKCVTAPSRLKRRLLIS